MAWENFADFGIFIDIDGNKTRTEIIDWSRAPLEFGLLPNFFVF